MVRYFVTLLLMFSFTELAAQQSSRTISGTIFDITTRKPIIDVNITLKGRNKGTASDENGRFSLDIGRNSIVLSVRHIGYEHKDIPVTAGSSDRTFNIYLKAKSIILQEIGVQAERIENEPQTFKLSGRFLSEIPDFSGETLSAVKTFPGVASNNEMSNQFSVQGGSPDENLILLEDIVISRSQRIRSSSQENISPINRMLMQDMSFTAGGFPAPYGERLSSVLETRYKKSSEKVVGGEVELGLLNLSAMLAGQPDSSFYWAIAGRYADRGLVLNSLQTSGDFVPKAHDVQAVLHYRINPTLSVLALGIYAENKFESRPKEFISHAMVNLYEFLEFSTRYTGHENFSRTQSIGSFTLNYDPNSKIHFKQNFSFGKSREFEDVDKNYETSYSYFSALLDYEEPIDTLNYGMTRHFDRLTQRSVQSKTHLQIDVDEKLMLETGIEFEQQKYEDVLDEYEFEHQYQDDSNQQWRSDEITADDDRNANFVYAYNSKSYITTRTNAGFINLHLKNGITHLETGLRLSRYWPSKEVLIKPRIGFVVTPDELTKFRIAYGEYSQPAGYHEMRSTNGQLLDQLPAQRAQHLVAGIQHFTDKGTEYQIQAFYKRLPNLIPYRTRDMFIEYEPELKATGLVYGGSLYWKGEVTPRMTSWFTYTYLFGEQEIAGEGASRLPFDQRHSFACVIQDNMPKYPNSKAHLRFLIGTGFPYTLQGLLINPANGRKELITGKRNALRLPYYRRIDIGYSYDWHFAANRTARLTFEIFNIFDFRNILGYGLISTGDSTEMFRYNLSRRFYSAKVNFIF